MSDINDRMREKTVQIASLNQKIDVLQAQLEGSQKRANQLGQRVQELETILEQKESEAQVLRMQLEKTKSALDAVGKEVREMRAEQTQVISRKQPGGDEYSLKEELEISRRKIEALQNDLKLLSSAASGIIKGEEGAREVLQEALMEVGDPKYKILNLVLQKRQVRLEEIAASLVLDMTDTLQLIESLQREGEIELRDGQTVIPGEKYRVANIPVEEWKAADPGEIFEQLGEIVGKTEGHQNTAKAIEEAVDILEQKIARGGALIFEMRRTMNAWHSSEGDIEELQYKIKEWKSRALALG